MDKLLKTGFLKRLDYFFSVFISVLLFFSGMMKLASLKYTAEEVFKMFLFTPIGYVNYDSSFFTVFALSILEVLISVLIWFKGKIRFYTLVISLFIVVGFLFVNIAQIYFGVEACACMGASFQVSPNITIFKTLILLIFVLTSIANFRLMNHIK